MSGSFLTCDAPGGAHRSPYGASRAAAAKCLSIKALAATLAPAGQPGVGARVSCAWRGHHGWLSSQPAGRQVWNVAAGISDAVHRLARSLRNTAPESAGSVELHLLRAPVPRAPPIRRAPAPSFTEHLPSESDPAHPL